MVSYILNNKDFIINIAFIIIPILALLFIFSSFLTPKIKKMPIRNVMIGYSLFYTDQKETNKRKDVTYSKILYSKKYDIQGKPDYIFKKCIGGNLVPVEIKSGKIRDDLVPHKGDLLQVAAYFLLIEDIYGIKPKFGRLIYSDYMFNIKNTASLRKEVKRTLTRMRSMLKTGEEYVNPSYATCRYCLCRSTVCQFCKNCK